MTLSPASGTGNGTVTLTATTGLAPRAPIAGRDAQWRHRRTPVTVPVTLTVPPRPAPAIGASPAALSFTATQGGANPATQTVTISNTGGGTLSWTRQ